MPRKAPDKVTEHRITLGAYERTQLETALKAEKFRDYSEAAVNGLMAGGVAAVGIGAIYAGYAAYKWVNEDILGNLPLLFSGGPKIKNFIRKQIDDAFDPILDLASRDKSKSSSPSVGGSAIKKTYESQWWNPLTW